MRCWRSWIGLQDKPSRQLVLNGSSSGTPKQWNHCWQQRCQNYHRGALKQHTALEVHIWRRFLKRRRTAICEDTSLAIPVEDQLWPWAQRLAFVNCVLDVCSSFLGELLNAQRQACQGGQCEVLKLHPVRSVLDPIRGQHCFLLYAQLGKIQEVSDQRILPILLRSSWNRFCLVYTVPNDCSDLTFRENHALARARYEFKWL